MARFSLKAANPKAGFQPVRPSNQPVRQFNGPTSGSWWDGQRGHEEGGGGPPPAPPTKGRLPWEKPQQKQHQGERHENSYKSNHRQQAMRVREQEDSGQMYDDDWITSQMIEDDSTVDEMQPDGQDGQDFHIHTLSDHDKVQTNGVYASTSCHNDESSGMENGIRLRSIWDFPQPISSIFGVVFGGFDVFNSMQTAIVDKALSDRSLCVFSPTGSGKTVVFEIAICSLFRDKWEKKSRSSDKKAIFLAPAKFLVSQKMGDWKAKFGGTLGLTLAELTGDTSTTLSDCLKSDIILATPEKWDSTTRRWRDAAMLMSKIKLFMVDEIHTVGDETRGACLEACMCRMKTIRAWQVAAKSSPLRIITVSATVPNSEDIGEWLGCDSDHTCVFGEEYRPVPLTYTVIGSSRGGRNEFVFDKGLNWKIPDIVRQHGQGRPVLVFCSTRKSAEQAAQHFAKEVSPFLTREHKQILWDSSLEISSVKDKSLREGLHAGVGFHNGALEGKDRTVVENLFIKRGLVCLFTTSTLAVGANLPAYLVIIKGTLQYQSGGSGEGKGWREYDAGTIQQMAGRAGRKGYDNEGRVVVLTEDRNVDMYQNIMGSKKPIESFLHLHLIEHLNSEIVLETILDISSVLDWASSTLLWVRAKKKPSHYFPKAVTSQDDSNTAANKVQGFIRTLMLDALNKLMSTNIPIVKATDEDGHTFTSTELGATMAKFYIAFSSMEKMIGLTATTTVPEMLVLISEMEEFHGFHCRSDQKKFLETCNKHDGIIFKVVRKTGTGGWTTARKVECLMKAAIGGVNIDNFTLKTEASSICDAGCRVTQAMIEYSISQKFFSTAARAVKLHQSISKKTWPDDTTGRLLMQLKGIGQETARKLSGAGISDLKHLDQSSPSTIDMVLNKNGFGSSVLDELRKIPCFSVSLKIVEDDHSKSFTKVEVMVQTHNWNGGGGHGYYCRGIVIVGFKDGALLMSRKFKATTNALTCQVDVERSALSLDTELTAHVMHESFVGRDAVGTLFMVGSKRSARDEPLKSVNKPQPPAALADKSGHEIDLAGAPTAKKPKPKPCKSTQIWDVHVGTPTTPALVQQQPSTSQTSSIIVPPPSKPDERLQHYLKSVADQEMLTPRKGATFETPTFCRVQANNQQARAYSSPAKPSCPGGRVRLVTSSLQGQPPPTPGRSNLADLAANIEELDRYRHNPSPRHPTVARGELPPPPQHRVAPSLQAVPPPPAPMRTGMSATSILSCRGGGGVAASYQGFGFLSEEPALQSTPAMTIQKQPQQFQGGPRSTSLANLGNMVANIAAPPRMSVPKPPQTVAQAPSAATEYDSFFDDF